MDKNWEYRRGDIYLADLSPFCGSEQGGVRPVVVIQNNTGTPLLWLWQPSQPEPEKRQNSQPIF